MFSGRALAEVRFLLIKHILSRGARRRVMAVFRQRPSRFLAAFRQRSGSKVTAPGRILAAFWERFGRFLAARWRRDDGDAQAVWSGTDR
jgi:hypothetical protein